MSNEDDSTEETSPSRREYLAALGGGMAAGMAGCTGFGGGGGGGGGQSNTLEEPIELYTWNLPFLESAIAGTEDSPDSWLEDFETQFDDKYEFADPATKWTDRGPGTEEILSYFQSRLQGGNPPNVFDTQQTTFARYNRDDVWASLNEWADDEFRSKYYSRLLEVMTKDGELVNMPFYMGTQATYSRNKWFDEAGIDPPSVGTYPSTMEYLDMTKEVVDNSGAEFGLVFIRFDWQLYPWFWSEGIDVLTDDGSEVAFGTDRTREILSRFRQLTQNGYMPEVAWTGNWKPAAEQFGAGNTAMYYGSGSALRLIQNYGSDFVGGDTVTIGGSPNNDRYGGLLTMHGLGVVKPNHSKLAQEASFDLISVITNEKWQEHFLRNTTVLVPNKSAVNKLRNDEEFNNNNPLLTTIYSLWDDVSSDVWVPPLIEGASEMAQIIDSQFSAAALGEKSVDEAVDAAVRQSNQAISN
ncbi:MAG: extracellular solute-binding protein [Halobacteriaceae archaeon]